ncbi:hypothetical protein [Pseudoalteromonas sp. TAB23]|uniref:hypothetical protein n=1 Tax=Pseudoalteromonas sp. TAB23 TaxID=1938595 RepID=UPI000463CD57|nr:hypothetical protein [Pseudoalteromonas sp. TAB23]
MEFLNIENLSFTTPEDPNQNNLDYISTISDPEVFLGILNKYISDKSLLKWVADRSYKHINHFDKIVLFDNEDPNSFRLTMNASLATTLHNQRAD